MNENINFTDFFPTIKDKDKFKRDINFSARETVRIADKIKEQENWRIKWKSAAIIVSLALVEVFFKKHDSIVTKILNYDFAIGAGPLAIIIFSILWLITVKRIKRLENESETHSENTKNNFGISIIRLNSDNSVELGVKKNNTTYYFDSDTFCCTSTFNREEYEKRMKNYKSKLTSSE